MGSITVLVAIAGFDESAADRYLDVLERLAGAGSLSVVLGHVYREADADRLEAMLDVDPRESRHLSAAAEHNTAVQHVADRLDELGVDYAVRGALGDPAEEILAIAEETDPDFVLLGGRKRSPTGKALFGSTSQRVLLDANRPVIYTGSGEE